MNYSYFSYIMFIPMLMISSMLIFITNSWFSMWMVMEISLLSIILLMLFDKLMKYELMMKYFLLQAFNSYLYLFNTMMMTMNNYMNMSLMIMNISILMKISIIPFHLWYIKIINYMNWNNIFLFTTINKIIPLYILMNIYNLLYNKIIILNFFVLIISSLISSLNGIYLINMKMIISFSSMIQMSWIIILMMFNEMISMIYFIIYMIISLTLYKFLYKFNIMNLIQLNYIKLFNKNMMMMFLLIMFSLSSIPPFFGFLMKWLSLMMFMNINLNFWTVMMLIINSLISIFFYFRIMFINLMNYFIINKLINNYLNNNNNLLNYKLILLNWINLLLLMFYEII